MESQKGQRKGKGAGAVKWVPPHREAYKANVDASMGKDRRRGVGVVVRNSRGEVRLAACKCIRADWEVDTTEAYAALYAMKLCWEAGIRRLELETDSKTTAEALSRRKVLNNYTSIFIHDAGEMEGRFDVISFSHVRRCANMAAHELAKLALQFDEEKTWFRDFPPSITAVIEGDKPCNQLPRAELCE